VELLKVDVEPGVPQRKDPRKVLERLAEVPRGARRRVSLLHLPVAEPQVLVLQVEVQLALVLRIPLQLKPVSVPRVLRPVAWASQVWFPKMCRRLRLAAEPQAAARLVLPERNRPELEDAALAPAWARRDRLTEQFRLRLPPGPTAQVF
jgi:hypothetical protein